MEQAGTEVIQMQALLRGRSRNRYERTGRSQNQVSSPDQQTYHAGIRQTGKPDTGRESRNCETDTKKQETRN